jgi:hypothetical protein
LLPLPYVLLLRLLPLLVPGCQGLRASLRFTACSAASAWQHRSWDTARCGLQCVCYTVDFNSNSTLDPFVISCMKETIVCPQA